MKIRPRRGRPARPARRERGHERARGPERAEEVRLDRRADARLVGLWRSLASGVQTPAFATQTSTRSARARDSITARISAASWCRGEAEGAIAELLLTTQLERLRAPVRVERERRPSSAKASASARPTRRRLP
jgi:hypothetical protein